MHYPKLISIPIVLSCATLTISGCGGGSGDSDDNTNTGETQTGSKITSENAEYYAAAAFASVDVAQRLPIRFGTLVSNDESNAFVYSDFVTEQFRAQKISALTAGRPLASKPVNCQVQITGDVFDELNLATGDYLTFDLNSCSYGTDMTVSNTITSTVTHVVGDFLGSPPYEVGFNTSLLDLTVTNSGHDYISNGQVLTLLADNGSGQTNASFSGDSINVDITGGFITYTLNLTNFEVDVAINNAGDFSTSLQGSTKMSVPFVDIDTNFTTITPFTGNSDVYNGNPTAGQLHLTGESATQAWVTAQPDGENVEIAIDLFGDGETDTTIMTTWSALESLIPVELNL